MTRNSSGDTALLPIPGPGDTTVEMYFADVEQPPSNLADLTKILVSKKDPSTYVGSLEFLFLKEGKWYDFTTERGRAAMTYERMAQLSDPKKYIMLGQPVMKEKDGTEHYALLQKISKDEYEWEQKTNSNLYKHIA